MTLARHALLALCVLPLCAPVGALAQVDKWGGDKPVDLKPMVPPVFVFPPDSKLNLGTVGSTPPYSGTPQQDRGSTSQPAPGIKLTIPSR